jgi:hypothetical protein
MRMGCPLKGIPVSLACGYCGQLPGHLDIVTTDPGTSDDPRTKHATIGGTEQRPSVRLIAVWGLLSSTRLVSIEERNTVTLSWAGDNGQGASVALKTQYRRTERIKQRRVAI